MKTQRFLKINILSDGMAFNGDTLKTESLGGTETAALQTAEMFAKLGHQVTILTNTNKPGNYNGIEYRNVNEFNKYFLEEPHDVSLVLRHPQLFSQPHNSQINILWQHDLAFVNDKQTFLDSVWNMDDVWCQSEFHKNQYQKVTGISEDAFWVAGSAIDPKLLPKEKIERDPKKLVYAGRPERGLETLVTKIMPKLLEYDNELKLHVTTYDNFAPHILALIEKIKKAGEAFKDSIIWHEPMTKTQLYTLFKSSYLYLYPVIHYNTSIGFFEETYCLSIDEAQVCGLPFISRPLGAIPETLNKDAGILVEGESEGFYNSFVKVVTDHLESKPKWELMSKAGERIALKEDTWEIRCKSFLDRIEVLLNRKAKTKQVRVPSRLVKNQTAQTLTVCILVRKEDKPYLIRCLNSVNGIANEVIVRYSNDIDSRFVNKTVSSHITFLVDENDKITNPSCECYLASSESSTWIEMGKQSNSEWLLWLYGSEELQNPDNLVKYLKNNCYEGYYIPTNKTNLPKANLVRRNLYFTHFLNSYKGSIKDVSIIDFSEGIKIADSSSGVGIMQEYLLKSLAILNSNNNVVTDKVREYCNNIIFLFDSSTCYESDNLRIRQATLDMYSQANKILNQGFDLIITMKSNRGQGESFSNMSVRFASIENAEYVLTRELREQATPLMDKYFLVR